MPIQVHALVLQILMKNVLWKQGIAVMLKRTHASVEISLHVLVNRRESIVTLLMANVNVLAMLMHVLFPNFVINMNFVSVDVAIHV